MAFVDPYWLLNSSFAFYKYFWLYLEVDPCTFCRGSERRNLVALTESNFCGMLFEYFCSVEPPGAHHVLFGMPAVLLFKRRQGVLPWYLCWLPCVKAHCHSVLSGFWRVQMLADSSTSTVVSNGSTMHGCVKEPRLTIPPPSCFKKSVITSVSAGYPESVFASVLPRCWWV